MKKTKILLGLVVIAAGIYYFTPSVSSIVSKLVNKYGSEVVGTEVNLSGFDLSLTEGTATVGKLTIANPANYTQPYLFELNNVKVKVDLKSLTSDTIVIEDIEVDKPAIFYEMLSLTQNNIKEIENNISNYTSRNQSADSKKEAAKDSKEEEGGKNVLIKRLSVKDASLSATLGEQNMSVTLPTITMTNIGGAKDKGTDIPTVIAKVMNKILQVASESVVSNNLNNLKSVAEENLNNMVGDVKDRVKNLGIFKQ